MKTFKLVESTNLNLIISKIKFVKFNINVELSDNFKIKFFSYTSQNHGVSFLS